ncbi:putative reverse transcriptase domain-containing protein [Tanacetum coccineum]
MRIIRRETSCQVSDETTNIGRNGPNWLFDIDALTKSMNYEPVVAGNQSNGSVGTKACDDAGKSRMETIPDKDYILLPFLTQDPSFSYSLKDSPNARFKPSREEEKIDVEHPENDIVSLTISTASIEDNVYSPIPTTRVHKDYPLKQIIRDIHSAPQTRRMTKNVTEHGMKKDERGIVIRTRLGWLLKDTLKKRELIMMRFQVTPKDSPFDVEAYTDSNYAGASLDRKSITRDETIIKEWEDRMERSATTASSLEAKQDSGNINRTKSIATLNESFPQGTDSLNAARHKLTIVGLVNTVRLKLMLSVQVNAVEGDFINTSIKVNGRNLIQALVDKKKVIITERGPEVIIMLEDAEYLQDKVHGMEESKTSQAKELLVKKKRVKHLENRRKSRTFKLKREDASKQGRKIANLDVDEEVTLIDETQERNDEERMFMKYTDAITKRMGTPTQYLCDYWSGWVRLPSDDAKIMPPRMRTRSAGRPASESLGGGTGERGLGANGGVEGVNGNVEGANRGAPDFSTIIAQQLQNLLPAMLAQDISGCSNDQKVKYTASSFVGKALTWWNSQIRTLIQEFVVSMSWNDFKFMMIQEFCPSHEMQKLESELWNHAMGGTGHAAYTNRFHELARLVPHLVTPESRMIERYVYGLALQIRGMVAATEPKTMHKAVQISGALTDEAVRNGSIKKVEKRGNVGETSKDKNGRDDYKKTRTGNVFATTVNSVGRENMGTWSKCTTCNSYDAPGGPCRTCFNCNRPGHLAKDCRGVPRNVNPVNARNPTIIACYECGSTDHVRSACPRLNRAQELEEYRPNQVAANN